MHAQLSAPLVSVVTAFEAAQKARTLLVACYRGRKQHLPRLPSSASNIRKISETASKEKQTNASLDMISSHGGGGPC
jgi:hypothetical protein